MIFIFLLFLFPHFVVLQIKRKKVEIVPFTLPPDETDKNPNSTGSCSTQKGLDF
jgi:hypothetical protein